MSDSVKNLLQSFIKFPQRICLFRKPEKEGIIEDGSLDDQGQISRVIEMMDKISKSELLKIREAFSLSWESKKFLNDAYKFFDAKEGFRPLLDGLVQLYSAKIQGVIKESENEIQIGESMQAFLELKLELENLKKLEMCELGEFLNRLGEISQEHFELVVTCQIWAYVCFLYFLSSALEVSFREIFKGEFQKTQALIQKELEEADLFLDMIKGSISSQQYDKMIAEKELLYRNLEEEKNKIIRDYELKNIEQVDQNLTALEMLATAGVGVAGLITGVVGGLIGGAGVLLGVLATAVVNPLIAGSTYYYLCKEQREYGRQLALEKENEKKIQKIQLEVAKKSKTLFLRVQKINEELGRTEASSPRTEELREELQRTRKSLTESEKQNALIDFALKQKSESQGNCKKYADETEAIMKKNFQEIENDMKTLQGKKKLSVKTQEKLVNDIDERLLELRSHFELLLESQKKLASAQETLDSNVSEYERSANDQPSAPKFTS
eukprot:TRINITY_DN1582_c0_g1_i2.p1 TRINITY_DN1582_c0_g1~~TRINITY_DN1582_c0_g1_i2.p1  ORF type:complete len:524 (-),score=133.17 TRINITY_DN1582_c0_g1_i2:301-1788(-)